MSISCTKMLPMHIAPYCSVAYGRSSVQLQHLFSHCSHQVYIDIHYAGLPCSSVTEFVFANCITQNAFCAEVIHTSHVSLTVRKGINFSRDLNVHSVLLHHSALSHAFLVKTNVMHKFFSMCLFLFITLYMF
jgi:hypothetical protein